MTYMFKHIIIKKSKKGKQHFDSSLYVYKKEIVKMANATYEQQR